MGLSYSDLARYDDVEDDDSVCPSCGQESYSEEGCSAGCSSSDVGFASGMNRSLADDDDDD